MSSDKYQRETVLVIEDDAGIAELEQMQLERAGFTVVTAGTSEEALDRLRRHHVDLLLLDYRLSGDLDGLDVYLECKAIGFELPVILVTGFSNEAVAIRALRAGVRDLITKSAEYLDYLPEAVERVLRQVRTERQLAESEARLTSIIDSANDAIIIAETGLQITLFNQAAEAMFRCPASDCSGSAGQPLYPPGRTKVRRFATCAGTADLPELVRQSWRADGWNGVPPGAIGVAHRRRRARFLHGHRSRHHRAKAGRGGAAAADRASGPARQDRRQRAGRDLLLPAAPDGSSCVPFAVPAIEDLFGIPREALAEDLTPLLANVHPDDLQPLIDEHRRGLPPSFEWRNTYRYLHPANGERWIEGWSAPQSQVEPDGSIVWHGFLMDVTERKQAEEEIRELNASLERRVAERTAELESMLASATIGLCFFDRDLRFLRINHCLAQINGIPVEAHLGRPLREVLPGMAETVEPIVRRIFETGRPVAEMEIEGTTPALPGERRSWLQGFYPVPGADGTIISVGATVTEITDRKRAEDKLAELNRILVAEIAEKERVEQQVRRLAAILEASTDFVGMADPEGRVLFLNRAFSESLGRSPEREPLTVSDCHPVDTVRVIHDDGIPTAARTGFWRGETEFVTHQGRSIPVSQLILGHSNPEGKLEFYSTIMRDISERKKMETALRNRGEELAVANAELARAARLKDEFLASMSHELRTPLNGILGMSEVLQEQVYGPLNAKQLGALRDVEECGRHLLALINDILDVAKIEAGKVELEPAPVAVEQLCQASLRLVKEPALKKKITVSLHHRQIGADLDRGRAPSQAGPGQPALERREVHGRRRPGGARCRGRRGRRTGPFDGVGHRHRHSLLKICSVSSSRSSSSTPDSHGNTRGPGWAWHSSSG